MTDTVRVAMMFPTNLKDELQELAGPRNMTNWVLNAIYDKLGQKAEGALDPADAKTLENQLKEARRLAQDLADAVAATDDDPNPQRVLQNRRLPDWLAQETWPVHLKSDARPTPPVEPKIDPEAQAEYDNDPKLREVLSQAAESPTVVGRNDLLARVQAKAKELGLTTASEIPSPRQPTHDDLPESQAKDPNACPTCGNELVENECWWCA